MEHKKERVIHTRIPAALEEQIKRVAEGLRVPVSNLVRNMLEDALDMTEAWAGNRQAQGGRDLAEIYGWQELTLNISAPCARCQKELAAGDRAFLGLTDRARDGRVFICSACLPRRSTNGHRKKKE